ncbi:MAG TPA: hypothetical protein VD999_01060 [Vitreimonas sp.]|nr:hypothetical protein [Vitreimonas sp.]
MSNENFNPENYIGVSVAEIFGESNEGVSEDHAHFSIKLRERLLAIEKNDIDDNDLPLFLYHLASAVANGTSLRKLADYYGLTHKIVGQLLQAAGIPYASRSEAVQRFWTNDSYADARAKNREATISAAREFWRDEDRSATARQKAREQMTQQRQDPAFVEAATEAARRTMQQRWQDPEYRHQHSEMMKRLWQDPEYRRNQLVHLFNIAEEFRNDPDYLEKLSEARRRLWEDPDFYEAHVQRSRENLARLKQTPEYREKRSQLSKKQWKNPEFRAKMAQKASRQFSELWKNPEFRAFISDQSRGIMTRLNQDPSFKQRQAEARLEREEDEEYQARISETRRQLALEFWQREDYRDKQTTAHEELWQDPEYRAHMEEIKRQQWNDLTFREKLILPTQYGYRSDIGFFAQSAMEANVARVFMHSGKEFMVGMVLELQVTEEFSDLFNGPFTRFNVDFTLTDRSSRTVIYELMAHPFEDPEGWAKLTMAQQQYPDIIFKVIDQKLYKRLQNRFEDAINNSAKFHGWEKTGFNLRTNPDLFG